MNRSRCFPILVLAAALVSPADRCLAAPPAESPQQVSEAEAKRLSAEREVGRRFEGQRSDDSWSPEYLQFLFEVAQEQREIFADKLRLAPSTLRGNRLQGRAPAELEPPEPAWINLGPTEGGLEMNVTYPDGTPVAKKIDAVDSGRVSQIIAQPGAPNTLFLAAAEGGLWKTTDGGRSWCSLTDIDSFPSLAVGAVALDTRTTPATLFLGLGDVGERLRGGTGRGIVTSADGGKTWTRPTLLGNSRKVTSILVHPEKPAIVLAGTDAGLFRSANGKRFSSVTLPLVHGAETVRDLAWIPGGKLLLTVGRNFAQEEREGDGAGVFFSTDDGRSWKPAKGLETLGPMSRISLGVAPKDPRIVYALAADDRGMFRDIAKSTDGGESFSPLQVAGVPMDNPIPSAKRLGSLFGPPDDDPLLDPQGIYDQLVIVDPDDPDVVYFAGQSNLVRTADGGKTYRLLSDWYAEGGLPYVHADFHTAAFDGQGNLWIGTDGGVAKLPKGGGPISTQENLGLATHMIYSISAAEGSNVIAAGLQDNGTRVRLKGGSVFPQRLLADGFDVAVHPRNPNRLLASLYFTEIYKSEDCGKTMLFSGSDIVEARNSKTAPFVTRIVPSPREGDDVVLTFVNEAVYKSTDFGSRWNKLPGAGLTSRIQGLAVAASDSLKMGALIHDGSVLLSDDGGSSWNPAAALPGSRGFLSAISFSPLDPKTIYVASQAPDEKASHLWRSQDGGKSWRPIDRGSFPTGAPVNVVVGDPGRKGTLLCRHSPGALSLAGQRRTLDSARRSAAARQRDGYRRFARLEPSPDRHFRPRHLGAEARGAASAGASLSLRSSLRRKGLRGRRPGYGVKR